MMEIKFHGGPYDGFETESEVIAKHAGILPVKSDLGSRIFVLMPPRENWEKLLRGEVVESSAFYPYEQTFDTRDPRLEWPPPGGFNQALLEAKMKIGELARTVLSSLSDSDRRAVLKATVDLQKVPPDSWPKDRIVRIKQDESVYVLRMVGDLIAFLRIRESGQLELSDVMREGTLRMVLDRDRHVGSAG